LDVVQAKDAVSTHLTSSPTLTSLRVIVVPIDSMEAVWPAVTTTSMLQGAGGLFGYSVKAGCPKCQTIFQRAEMEKLRGQCLTAGCGNRVFLVQVQPDSEWHWLRIVERLSETAPGVTERTGSAKQSDTEKERDPSEQPDAEFRLKQRWWVWSIPAFGVVILFFLVRYWYWGLPIPLVHKPQQYQFQLVPNEENTGAQ
jgi:hypothetical protein